MTTTGRVRPSKPASAFALIFGIVFVVFGVSAAIPSFGMFGVVWTLGALAICVYFAINLFSGHGLAEKVVEFDTSTPSRPDAPAAVSAEERLSRLEELKGKGFLSEDEYQQQRKKIIGDL